MKQLLNNLLLIAALVLGYEAVKNNGLPVITDKTVINVPSTDDEYRILVVEDVNARDPKVASVMATSEVRQALSNKAGQNWRYCDDHMLFKDQTTVALHQEAVKQGLPALAVAHDGKAKIYSINPDTFSATWLTNQLAEWK